MGVFHTASLVESSFEWSFALDAANPPSPVRENGGGRRSRRSWAGLGRSILEPLEDRRLLAAGYYQLAMGASLNPAYYVSDPQNPGNVVDTLHIKPQFADPNNDHLSAQYLSLTPGGGCGGNTGAVKRLIERTVEGSVPVWYEAYQQHTTHNFQFVVPTPFGVSSSYDAASDTYKGTISFDPPDRNPDGDPPPTSGATECRGYSGPSEWAFSLSPLTASITTTNPAGFPVNGVDDGWATDSDQNGQAVNGNLFVMLNGAAEGSVNVPLLIDQTSADSAKPGYDYQELPSTVTIPAGQTVAQIPVVALPIDPSVEGPANIPTRTVSASIIPGDADVQLSNGGILADPTTARAGGVGNDQATVRITRTDGLVLEATYFSSDDFDAAYDAGVARGPISSAVQPKYVSDYQVQVQAQVTSTDGTNTTVAVSTGVSTSLIATVTVNKTGATSESLARMNSILRQFNITYQACALMTVNTFRLDLGMENIYQFHGTKASDEPRALAWVKAHYDANVQPNFAFNQGDGTVFSASHRPLVSISNQDGPGSWTILVIDKMDVTVTWNVATPTGQYRFYRGIDAGGGTSTTLGTSQDIGEFLNYVASDATTQLNNEKSDIQRKLDGLSQTP